MSVNAIVTLVFRNEKALRALVKVAEVLTDVEEDMPWRDDVKKARKAAMYACENIDVIVNKVAVK